MSLLHLLPSRVTPAALYPDMSPLKLLPLSSYTWISFAVMSLLVHLPTHVFPGALAQS